MPTKTSATDPGPATAPAELDPQAALIAGQDFAHTLPYGATVKALGMIAQRLASGTKRNGVVPAELVGIPKAALKKLADVLDLYADSLPAQDDRHIPPHQGATFVSPPGGGHVDASAYLADPDPGAEYAGPPEPVRPGAGSTELVSVAQADPELEHSVADQLDNRPAVVGQPYPLEYGPTDDERAPAPVVGNPFSTRRAAPVALDPSSVSPTELTWPDHDSVSAIQTFAECGWRYLAEYGHGLKNVGAPAWWNVGGTAAHVAIEAWERTRAQGLGSPSADDTAKVFSEQLALERDELVSMSGVTPDGWRTANQGREDGAWWADHGPNMVARYVLAQEGRDFEPIQVGGTLGLELAGTVHVGPERSRRAFEVRIDAVLENAATGEIRVRDYKYGRNVPAPGGLQLPAYRFALAHLAGGVFELEHADISLPGGGYTGEYWAGRKGEATAPIPLPYHVALRRVTTAVATLESARQAHVFMPNPSSFCGACPLKPICPAHTGDGKSVIDS